MGREFRKKTTPAILRSWVWTHFNRDPANEDFSRCKLCDYTYLNKNKDGCTNPLKHHLKRKHGVTKPEIVEFEDKHKHKTPTTTLFPGLGYRKSAAEWLCYLVIEDGISFNVIRKSKFFKAAFHHMHLDFFSSHNTIRAAAFKFLDKCKDHVKSEIKTSLAAGKKFSALADEWTSINSRRYMNVCLSTVDKTIGLGMVRCKGSITAARTVELIKKRLEEFGLIMEDLAGFCSDGASVMKAAGRMMKIPHQLCLGNFDSYASFTHRVFNQPFNIYIFC